MASTTTIEGPVTGARYTAVDTGQTWNGAPVLGFTLNILTQLIAAGDGQDCNGEGLLMLDGLPQDLCEGQAYPVPRRSGPGTIPEPTLYVPQGRIWTLLSKRRSISAGEGEPEP